MRKCVLVFFLIFKAHAEMIPMCGDLHDHMSPLPASEVKNIFQIIEAANNDPQNVAKYPEFGRTSCRTRLSPNEIERRINQKAFSTSQSFAASPYGANYPFVSVTSHGVKFKNEHPSLISLFSKLMTKDQRNNRGRAQKYTMQTSCDKVICAVKEKFGNEVGPKLLYILQEYGLNGSHLSYPLSSPWQNSELDELLMGLEDLPKGLLPLGRMRSFTRMRRGCVDPSRYSGARTCTMAISTLRFYDCLWSPSFSLNNRLSTTIHEIGHTLSYEFDETLLNEWKGLSGWIEKSKIEEKVESNQVSSESENSLVEFQDGCYRPKKSKKSKSGSAKSPSRSGSESSRRVRKRVKYWESNQNACFISGYAKTSFGEDFAESFSAYRYIPQVLKEKCPTKYNFIKNKVMYGIEFLPANQFCQRRPRFQKENSFLRFLENLWPF